MTDTRHVYATHAAKLWHRSVAATTEAARDQPVLCRQPMRRWTHTGVIFQSEIDAGLFRVCKKCAAVADAPLFALPPAVLAAMAKAHAAGPLSVEEAEDIHPTRITS